MTLIRDPSPEELRYFREKFGAWRVYFPGRPGPTIVFRVGTAQQEEEAGEGLPEAPESSGRGWISRLGDWLRRRGR